jgi:DNA invertase Pin-like site-specific DNA recombinase
MAMVADEERRMISKRTKDALAAAKRRGTKLGGDRGVLPSRKTRAMAVEALEARADARAARFSSNHRRATGGRQNESRAIAAGLNDQAIPTARGGKWSSPQVMRMLERI